MLYSVRHGGVVYAEVYRNAAVSDSVSAYLASSETHIQALYRTAVHDGVDFWTCQRGSGGAVDTGHDLGVGTAGDCDVGDCISHQSLRNPDACGEAGDAYGSDGGVCMGNCILTEENSGGMILPLFFDRNIHNYVV